MQAFADKLAGERAADNKLPVAPGFTGGKQCYYATLILARKHLPGYHLAGELIPVLVNPPETEAVTLLPHTYWDDRLRAVWTGADR